jgi:ribosomal protein L29
MENQLKKEMENKEFKMKELNSLINQKEENGNEIEYHLNQLKAELINLREDK